MVGQVTSTFVSIRKLIGGAGRMPSIDFEFRGYEIASESIFGPK